MDVTATLWKGNKPLLVIRTQQPTVAQALDDIKGEFTNQRGEHRDYSYMTILIERK